MDNPGTAPRLYERATEALLGEIASGALPDGARLTQSGVAARFGISRAPARQALADLETRGYLRRKGRGFEVCRAGSVPPRPAPAPDRLHFRQSWELIYPDIENDIAARLAIAGWRINEAQMARHYRVSRTVAREVMARLQQRGIVTRDDRGRWLAPALTPALADNLYELRWVLEPLALEKAHPHLPQGYIAALLADLEVAMGHEPDGAALDRLEHQLHVDLLGHCGNAALMQAISLPQALLVAHRFLYRCTPDIFGAEPFLPEHHEILSRLARGDIAGAKAALVMHLRDSRARAVRRIEAVRAFVPPEDLSYLERLDPA